MTNQFFNLRALIANKVNEGSTKLISELATITDVSSITDKWYYRNLMTKGAQTKKWELKALIEYLTARITKQALNDIQNKYLKLDTVGNAERLITNIAISVEWTKNRTWGNCPKAEIRVCFNNNTCDNYESSRITGCGYDKESTAIANALNQCNELLKAMYVIKENAYAKSNHDIFGYGSGSGSGITPYLEGGVGVSCYPAIFKTLGYEWEGLSHGKTFDVYAISKK